MSDDGANEDEDTATCELVAAAQAGDEAARERLFARYLPRVARLVATQLGVRRSELPEDAEDIAQEAIVRALRGLSKFEMRGGGAFTAWLATIVENCVRSRMRQANGATAQRFWQRYGDLDLCDSLFAGRGPTPSGCAATEETNRAIEAAVLALPHVYRRALSLRYFAGMSHAEIAQAIGHTEGNSRKLVQRALDMLRAGFGRA